MFAALQGRLFDIGEVLEVERPKPGRRAPKYDPAQQYLLDPRKRPHKPLNHPAWEKACDEVTDTEEAELQAMLQAGIAEVQAKWSRLEREKRCEYRASRLCYGNPVSLAPVEVGSEE